MSERIHPKVNGRKARIGMCCMTAAVVTREDHQCLASLEESVASS